MKEYKVAVDQVVFYNKWLNNRKWTISNVETYSIKCTTREQIDYCISLLRKIEPNATAHHDSYIPAYVRWFDAKNIGGIMIVEQRNAGNHREFFHVFEEMSGVGHVVESSEDSISLISKRLEGHVITL